MVEERKPALRVTCPLELVGLLRAGDRLAYCQGEGWRLVRAGTAVEDQAAQLLRSGGLGYAVADGVGGHVPLRDLLRGGRLAPMGDALLPGFPAQTWAWAEGRSNARH